MAVNDDGCEVDSLAYCGGVQVTADGAAVESPAELPLWGVADVQIQVASGA